VSKVLSLKPPHRISNSANDGEFCVAKAQCKLSRRHLWLPWLWSPDRGKVYPRQATDPPGSRDQKKEHPSVGNW